MGYLSYTGHSNMHQNPIHGTDDFLKTPHMWMLSLTEIMCNASKLVVSTGKTIGKCSDIKRIQS